MRLVVLGDPIAHSRSPAIHTAALAACGIEGDYTARRVDPDGLIRAVEEIRSGALDGANVTMPHKAAAAAGADVVDAVVEATGAANTLRHREGAVEATNTDVAGLQRAAREARIPDEAPVLVLGGGGAAAAAIEAFAGCDLRVSTRSGVSPGGTVAHEWGRPLPGAIVVNATPLGMHGEPLPRGVVEEAAGLVDLSYGAGATPAVEASRMAGIPVADGLDVLVGQAAESFTWWTGVEAPLEVMQSAARRG